MTQAETYPTIHHHFRTFAVMTLAGSAVLGAGYMVSGGVNSIRHQVNEAKTTSFGLKNINLETTESRGEALSVGTAASSCLGPSDYGVDRVYKASENPDTYKVTVQKVGRGALDRAAVEACIFKETGDRTELVVGHS